MEAGNVEINRCESRRSEEILGKRKLGKCGEIMRDVGTVSRNDGE